MMVSPGVSFTDEDLEIAKEFEKYVSEMEFTGKVSDVAKFYRCMVWYIKLTQKIKGSILEVKKIHDPSSDSDIVGAAEPAPSKEPKKSSSKKSKK